MITLSQALLHYKRKDIQEAMVAHAIDKEVAVKFGEKGFGKRPDTLTYPRDVLELARQGATSFHASEEIWKNPLQLDPAMKRKDMESLRKGWDLVLDIDCPYWVFSKITAYLFIKALKLHGINTISCKFSGNKGFHIGVPFEAFPDKVGDQDTASLFPDGPRRIAAYLLDYISGNLIEIREKEIVFDKRGKYTFEKIEEITKKKISELEVERCSNCHAEIKQAASADSEFICPKCEQREKANAKFLVCPKCKSIMNKVTIKKAKCSCGSNTSAKYFNLASLVSVDTLLISSRHMYRMPYSFNEKSGLVSVPISLGRVLSFKKEEAMPKNIKSVEIFLDRKKAVKGEANRLFVQALDFSVKQEQSKPQSERKYSVPEQAIPEDFFPPCIQNILKGLEDGRKRSVFILLNFLRSLGWSYEMIDELLKKWNKKNPEELREVNLLGQLRYHQQQKKKMLPPNCANKMYYQDMRVCTPDNLCQYVKNPVNYARRKSRYSNKEK